MTFMHARSLLLLKKNVCRHGRTTIKKITKINDITLLKKNIKSWLSFYTLSRKIALFPILFHCLSLYLVCPMLFSWFCTLFVIFVCRKFVCIYFPNLAFLLSIAHNIFSSLVKCHLSFCNRLESIIHQRSFLNQKIKLNQSCLGCSDPCFSNNISILFKFIYLYHIIHTISAKVQMSSWVWVNLSPESSSSVL
jgi:hypothetical protein